MGGQGGGEGGGGEGRRGSVGLHPRTVHELHYVAAVFESQEYIIIVSDTLVLTTNDRVIYMSRSFHR